jgi:mRNA interferase MazF
MSSPELKSNPDDISPRYGEIYEVNLEPILGSETGKHRPAVVVSNDINNELSRTVTVLHITGQPAGKQYPFEVFIPAGIAGLNLDSRIKANQIRTIDKRHLVRYRGSLPSQYLPQIEKAMKIHLNMK